MLSPAGMEKFQQLLKRYPNKQAALLPTLHLVQSEVGYVSKEAIDFVAGLLALSPTYVHSVASFYTMFYKEKMGKYVIQVCRTLPCALCGSRKILEYLKGKLGIEVGETTPDGKFSLVTVECLASCGTAPVIQINDDYYEGLNLEKVDRILEQLSRE
ncbi:MAG: NADH-quinone oxidoreductase subunit NuoE [Candidatus Tectomicrobia bacterium]|uniref:NADH-quinone oxidoreductase subunit NuoE n=1 Tax=Tectimicrobiota bacterium TaxID=2528274 RepID=A0A932M161_UNCTE|nr:NADH-quinone oxidoreductase subunit NuoE [Candidatus Tectomicrobia bacterium]